MALANQVVNSLATQTDMPQASGMAGNTSPTPQPSPTQTQPTPAGPGTTPQSPPQSPLAPMPRVAPPNPANGNAPPPIAASSQAPGVDLWALKQQLSGMAGGDKMYQDLLNQYQAKNLGTPNPNDTSSQYYRRDPQGQIWQTTPGSPTGFQYGASAPAAGVDIRNWTNVDNPLAYQYGGQMGGAASEEQRYAQMGQNTGQMNLGNYNNIAGQYGGDTNNALSMLQQRANGQGPSIADAQMQQGLSQARQAQMQQAASARGGGANLVAAEQLAGSNASQQQSASLGQAATARAQEQIGAQQAYGTLANQAYATQGGLAAQLAQQQAALSQQGQLAYESMRQGVFNQQLGAQQAGEAANAGAYQFGQNQNMQQQQIDSANRNALVGGLLTTGGAVLGGLVGGPAGAAAGGMAGNAAAKAV